MSPNIGPAYFFTRPDNPKTIIFVRILCLSDFLLSILDKSPQPDSPDSTPIAGSRPVRAAVVNAAAISEAQADILSSLGRRTSKMRGRGKYKHLNEGDRLPRIFKSGPKKARRKTGIFGVI